MTINEQYWKVGNIILTNKEGAYLIVDDQHCVSLTGFMTRRSFDDDLLCIHDHEFDVKEIYKFGTGLGIGLSGILNEIEEYGVKSHNNNCSFSRIWSRPIAIHITTEQIREKFNLPKDVILVVDAL